MTPYYSDDLVSLYLGDFRDVDVPEPTATITDPPYGETNLRWDRWIDDWPGLIPGRVLWCFGSMRLFLEHVGEFGGWKFAQDVVWEKHSGSSLATDRFRRVHEHAVQFYRGTWRDLNHNVPRERVYGVRLAERVQRGTSKGEHLGGVKPGTTWKDDRTRLMRSVMYSRSMHRRAVHPTEKLVAVVAPLVEFSTNPGDLIYDPFAGSGTTLVVAKTLGRRAIGVEIDERYCEAAAARLAQDSLGLSA